MPLASGGGGAPPEYDDTRDDRRRSRPRARSPSPPRKSKPSKSSKSKKHSKRHRSPSSSTSESESNSESSSSGYSSYESVEKIHKKLKEKPCEYVSPAGLGEKKTKKEAIKYLREKECPRVEDFKRTASTALAAPSVASTMGAAPVPPPANVLSVSAEPVPEKKRIGRPPKPKEPKKREPSAYAMLFGEARKAGKPFAEATAYAKAEAAKLKTEAQSKKDE
jgi:hypothetical protein